MGACSSRPVGADELLDDFIDGPAAAAVERSRPSAALAAGVERLMSMTAPRRALRCDGRPPGLGVPLSCPETEEAPMRGPGEILQYMNDLLLELQMVSGSAPGLVLPELAERLVGQLGEVDLVRVEAVIEAPGGGPTSAVLLAAHGVGAAVCEEAPVAQRDAAHAWSALHGKGGPEALYVPAAAAFEATGQPLPEDFRRLHHHAGLSSFLSVLVCAGSQTLGCLTVAAQRPGAFSEPWWQPILKMCGSALLPHLRNRQLVDLCRTLVAVDTEQDAAEAASLAIYGVSQFMRVTTNLSMAVRLGLIHADRVLIIEQDPHDTTNNSGSGSLPRFAQAPHRVVASDIPLAGTLLGSALAARKARFVSDAALYFQRALQPASDVFTPASQLVSSLVVIPLCDPSVLGGIYFSLDAPDDFSQLQAPILGVVSMISVLLHRKLSGQADLLRDRIAKASAASPPATASRSTEPGGPADRHLSGDGNSEAGLANGGLAVQTSSLSFTSRRLNTDAIMKAVQLRLAMAHNGPDVHQSLGEAQRCAEDLTLEEALGRGGYGVCYRAHFRGATVAVKVLYAREHQREAMKDAVEMAVLSHIRHPGIVGVFSCFTDMIEDDSVPGQLPRYRPALPEDGGYATCNVIVMEYCDMGSLRDAVKRGLFHAQVSPGVIAVDLLKVVKVLLEVARSVEYLHERRLLHCDLKLDNVLLKSDPTHDLGFACKLADFGLAKMMNEQLYVQNRSGSGTITHLAPEVLHAGSKLTTAIDAYAFAVLAYELYTGSRAFAGLRHEKVIECVTRRGVRPALPEDAPAPLASLVTACWASDPNRRPAFPEITARLREMLTGIEVAEAEQAGDMFGGSSDGGGSRGGGGSSRGGGGGGGSNRGGVAAVAPVAPP